MERGKRLGESDAVALDDDIDIEVGLIEQQIAHKTAHRESHDPELVGDRAYCGQ